MAYRRKVVPPKRNGIRINDLPDSLLSFILSKISLKQAVRCSVISKRWKFLWTFMQSLKFSGDFFFSLCRSIEFQNRIDSIFDLHSGPLELVEFIVFPFYTNEKICEWIQRAALKDVRDIRIENTGSIYQHPVYEVPTSILLCHKLRSLALKHFHLTNIFDCFGGFPGLVKLDFCYVELNDKTFELILQLCPVLEILILSGCFGLKRLKICSNSLISLNISSEIKAIKANCPRLVSLIIEGIPPIVKMELYLPACSSLFTYAQLTGFVTLKSLKKITFIRGQAFLRDLVILKEFPDLEQICIDKAEEVELSDLEGHYGRFPPLDNLKYIHLNITLFFDPTFLLTFLFRLAPALKTILVSREKGFDGINALRYVNDLLNVRPKSTQTKILLSRNSIKEVRCLNCDLEKARVRCLD